MPVSTTTKNGATVTTTTGPSGEILHCVTVFNEAVRRDEIGKMVKNANGLTLITVDGRVIERNDRPAADAPINEYAYWPNSSRPRSGAGVR